MVLLGLLAKLSQSTMAELDRVKEPHPRTWFLRERLSLVGAEAACVHAQTADSRKTEPGNLLV